MKKIAIVFAGGVGSRMGSKDCPKQFLEINGKSIIIHTLENFQNHPEIDKIYISCLEEWIPRLAEEIVNHKIDKVERIVPGGTCGQDSIYNGLKAAEAENPDDSIVLIHDGVRPFITSEVISKNINSVIENGTAITTTPCFETIILSENGVHVKDVPLRKETYAAQAPQSFVLKDIIEAHDTKRASKEGYEDVVDSCTLYRLLGREVHLVEGNRGNIKITTPDDYFTFKGLLEYRENAIVNGYNINYDRKDIVKDNENGRCKKLD